MFTKIVAGLLVAVWIVPAASAADNSQKVIDDFLAAVQASDQFNQEQVAEVVEVVDSYRHDDYYVKFTLMESLRVLYPEFGEALDILAEEEDAAPAIAALTEMTTADDPFLAAEASLYLGRTLAIQERYEEAIPLLESLIGSDKSVQGENALYLLAITQSGLLQRQQAAKNLQRFLDEYPDAPERMRVGAQRQLAFLEAVKPDTITDAFERMDFSRRRLQLEETGDPTQEQQHMVVAILDKLIKDAEQRESQSSSQSSSQQKDCQKCEGEGCKECEGNSQGESESASKSQQGGRSKNPDGVAKRSIYNGPQSPWSKLRDKDRDPAYTAIKKKLPARFETLIEQYYQSIQDGAER